MTMTRGPAVSMIRSMYRPATSSSVAVTAAWSAGMSGASASQPEKAASRAIAAMAPPNRLPTSGARSGVKSIVRAKVPESTACSSATACAKTRANRYGSAWP